MHRRKGGALGQRSKNRQKSAEFAKKLEKYIKIARKAERHDLLQATLPLRYIPPHLWTPEDRKNFDRLKEFASRYEERVSIKPKIQKATKVVAGVSREVQKVLKKYAPIFSAFNANGEIIVEKALKIDPKRFESVPKHVKEKLDLIVKLKNIIKKAENLPQQYVSPSILLKIEKLHPNTLEEIANRVTVLEGLHNYELPKVLGVQGKVHGRSVEGTLLDHLASIIGAKYGVRNLLDINRLTNKHLTETLARVKESLKFLKNLEDQEVLGLLRAYEKLYPGRSILNASPGELEGLLKTIQKPKKEEITKEFEKIERIVGTEKTEEREKSIEELFREISGETSENLGKTAEEKKSKKRVKEPKTLEIAIKSTEEELLPVVGPTAPRKKKKKQ